MGGGVGGTLLRTRTDASAFTRIRTGCSACATRSNAGTTNAIPQAVQTSAQSLMTPSGQHGHLSGSAAARPVGAAWPQ